MMCTNYEYLVSQQEDTVSNFDGYPGQGGFYEPSLRSAEPEPPAPDHLALARKQIEDYEKRANLDRIVRTELEVMVEQLHEDRAYKRAMMHAALAQAEASTRQADALEAMLFRDAG